MASKIVQVKKEDKISAKTLLRKDSENKVDEMQSPNLTNKQQKTKVGEVIDKVEKVSRGITKPRRSDSVSVFSLLAFLAIGVVAAFNWIMSTLAWIEQNAKSFLFVLLGITDLGEGDNKK